MFINGTEYTDIKNLDLNSVPDSDLKTLEFSKGWLNNQPSFHIHTSGSTGKPKLISIKREQMIISAKMTGKALGLEKNDKAFVCLNTEYIAGMMMLVRGFELDLKLTVVPPSSNPFKNLPSGSTFDFVALVPLQIQTILKESDNISFLQNMKAIILGGGAINSDLEKKIQKIKSPVYLTYGMTETVSHIALRRINGKERSDLFTCLEGVHIRVDSRQCLEICAPVTNNEWITTNDIVELSEENKFKWIGRIDNVINSGGIKIQTEILEAKIEKIFLSEGIDRRFFISGVPHPDLGESILLAVEGVDKNNIAQQISSNLRTKLNKFEIPKSIKFIEKFKMTETDKVDRKGTINDKP